VSIFRRKKADLKKHDDGLHEAERAVRRADKSVREAKETGKDVTQVAGKLKRHAEKNNFAEAIARALGGTG
jgi:hypothetical protein